MNDLRDYLRIKPIHEAACADDGFRVLVDRLWPRGVSEDDAALDRWLGAVAPSPNLRTWWHHDPKRLDAFATRYRVELDYNPAVIALLDLLDTHARLTLVYSARDPQVNHAEVLRQYLTEGYRLRAENPVRAARQAAAC